MQPWYGHMTFLWPIGSRHPPSFEIREEFATAHCPNAKQPAPRELPWKVGLGFASQASHAAQKSGFSAIGICQSNKIKRKVPRAMAILQNVKNGKTNADLLAQIEALKAENAKLKEARNAKISFKISDCRV